MFVPRALRLKGLREKPRANTSQPLACNGEPDQDEALVKAMENTSTNSPTPQAEEHSDQKSTRSGPRFTTKPVTPEYVAQLAAGIELIFTDYALQEEERAKWLRERYRTIDGEENYIHLTAILEHPNISSLKPEASQVLLQQALRDHPSKILEVSSSGYYVRRQPSSYPPKYLPNNSFEVVDDDGLAFWDQRTIYVEPHIRNLCQTPARVARWLTEHGELRPKWLPVQAVHMLWNSCAFVVLSGSVMHGDVWNKWRETEKPDNWKIMTKVEHTKRTAEYIALLKKENPRGMSKTKIDNSKLPPIARPAALQSTTQSAPDNMESDGQQGKKKRKRRKPNKSNLNTGDADAEDAGNEPSTKRRG